MFQATTATNKLLKLKKRIRGVSGGTGASKTISILLILIDYAESTEDKLISVVSESHPHLRRGAIRDFLNIMHSHRYYDEKNWNRTTTTYTFSKGSQIEFFPADDPSKLRGGRRDVLFINEANNVKKSAFDELEIRTREIVWLDWNPTNSFWWYEEILPNMDVDFITLTYKDNETLEESIINSIESRRLTNPNWYKVYALGQLGSLEGVIYNNWKTIKDIPKEALLVRRGLDFGYTNDPSVLVDIYRWNKAFILDELLYATRMSNKQIADIIQSQDSTDVFTVADSAEPKSIDEISGYGVDIYGATKGQGSVSQGIQLVQDQQLYITERSVNVIKDFRNYMWKTDRSGKPMNIPEHDFSHSPDAARYGLVDVLGGLELTMSDIAL